MEKISSILPANARVTTVDLKNSGVARSGTPSFGREVGMSSVIERNNQTDIANRASMLQSEQLKQRISVKTDPQAEIVQRMADNFFMNKARQLEEEKSHQTETPNDLVLRQLSDEVTSYSTQPYSNEVSEPNAQSDEDGAVVGQHLDVMA